MSGYCQFCGICHSGSCCHPGRSVVTRLRKRVQELERLVIEHREAYIAQRNRADLAERKLNERERVNQGDQ